MGEARKIDLDLRARQEADESLAAQGVRHKIIVAQEDIGDETAPLEPASDGLKLWQDDETLAPDDAAAAPNAQRDALVQTISTHVILNTMIGQRYGRAGVTPAPVYQALRDPALLNPEINTILTAAGTTPTQINQTNYQRHLQALEGQYDENQVAHLVNMIQQYINNNTPTVTAEYSQRIQTIADNLVRAQPNYMQTRPMNTPQPRAASYNKRRLAQMEMAPEPPMEPAPEMMGDPLSGDPLSSEPFRSVDQLEKRLLQFRGDDGRAELYNKVFDLVGPENEDRAKSALAKLFQGLASGLFNLYRIFQEKGLASPIDEEMVEKIMDSNPDIVGNGEPQEKVQGLYLPPSNSGLYTTAEGTEKLTKEASGYLGGPNVAYFTHGPGENRMCPKIRNLVNTYICRYHCLDGLAIDDTQVVCGEALWRQNVMDKYSREYRDKDGNWVGGYINERFEVHHDTGGHPYQLKPDQRHAPIHEDAWSMEKRLQEMRRAEGKHRGYAETPGDPKGIYNFDQHDIAKGPTPPNLSDKERDKLAKNSGIAGKTKKANQDWIPLAKQDPREFGDDSEYEAAREILDHHRKTGEPITEDELRTIVAAKLANEDDFENRGGNLYWEVMDVPEDWGSSLDDLAGPMAGSRSFNLRKAKKDKGEKKDWNSNPWAVCHTTVDKDKDPDKHERCVQKQSSFNRAHTRLASNGGDPMMDHVDHGPRQKQCKRCRKMNALEAKVCDGQMADPAGGPPHRCGGMDFITLYEGDVKGMTGAIESPELDLKASNDKEITYSNGVFRAANNDGWAYGISPKQAADRLDQQLQHAEPPGVQEMSQEILNKMKQDDVPVPAPAPVASAPEQASEEWSLPGKLPPMSSPEPIFEEGEDEFDPSENDFEPVLADELDAILEDDAVNTPPEEQAEIDAQADALGLGPDR